MGRTKFSEAGPRRPGGRHSKSAAALAAKSGFDGLSEAPWRKTPSIFKQPVTLVHTSSKSTQKMSEATQKKFSQLQLPKEKQIKPQQVYWSKRLEGLKSMVPVHFSNGVYTSLEDEEYLEQNLKLVNKIESAVNVLAEDAAAASFCSALQLSNGVHIKGNNKQSGSNPMTNLNLNEPIVTIAEINDQDITQQEKRVIDARKRLQELRKSYYH